MKNKKIIILISLMFILLLIILLFIYFFKWKDNTYWKIDLRDENCIWTTIKSYEFNIDEQKCEELEISWCLISTYESIKDCKIKNWLIEDVEIEEKDWIDLLQNNDNSYTGNNIIEINEDISDIINAKIKNIKNIDNKTKNDTNSWLIDFINNNN